MKKMLLGFLLLTSVGFSANPPEKLSLCIACHGQNGEGVKPEWPNLAGQHASYLKKQLHDLKDGKSIYSPVMSSIAANLSDVDIEELANYYAALPKIEGVTPKKWVERGEKLYRGGDFKEHITACIACHGPKGTGNAEAGFPLLSGQKAEYVINQLMAFKSKARHNDLNSIMQDISGHLSKDDMTALAYYIQGLY